MRLLGCCYVMTGITCVIPACMLVEWGYPTFAHFTAAVGFSCILYGIQRMGVKPLTAERVTLGTLRIQIEPFN
jgi:hypothetical protein